jgi:3-phenylpropionate/trans-cinnamate dioxygenase ferredoxin subunit
MPQYVKIAEVGELNPGTRKFVEVDGYPVLLFNIDGDYFAISATCSHQDQSLADGELVDGHKLECPAHGALFDIRTGKALTFPAVSPVLTYEVKIEGKDILVATE